MDEFEADKKDSHKPNEGLHGVVEGEKNAGRRKGGGEKGLSQTRNQPDIGFCSRKTFNVDGNIGYVILR